jgi:hypothetical protein
MKKIYIITLFLVVSCISVYAQEPLPDYTVIQFRSRIKEYKTKKPKIDKLKIDKELISDIVRILGKSHYSKEQRDEITEKLWLAFTDPKKFDLVFKDYAIRTLPNWNKLNFQGKIVLDPNPYLKSWTKADDEQDYFKIAMNRILMYEGLMGYGEDAKETKKSLVKMKYVKNFKFRPVYSKDWTNSYLKSIKPQLDKKNLIMQITNNGNYEFMICEKDKKAELLKLFARLRWKFINP